MLSRRTSPTKKTFHQLRMCQNNSHWSGTLQVRARRPRRRAQRIRKVSCSSDCCGYRQRHARASLSERSREQVRTHYQGVARNAQIAPCRDMRRSNANARAAVPERPILPRPRDIVADWEELFSEAASLGFTTKAGVSCEKCHVRLFRCILSCVGAPRRTQELFGRGFAFPFWIRSERCAVVSCGFWFERCTTHVVPYRGCSWKGCASNVDGRPLVRPYRRPTPARQAASSRVTL